jgi:hypothetical protein
LRKRRSCARVTPVARFVRPQKTEHPIQSLAGSRRAGLFRFCQSRNGRRCSSLPDWLTVSPRVHRVCPACRGFFLPQGVSAITAPAVDVLEARCLRRLAGTRSGAGDSNPQSLGANHERSDCRSSSKPERRSAEQH